MVYVLGFPPAGRLFLSDESGQLVEPVKHRDFRQQTPEYFGEGLIGLFVAKPITGRQVACPFTTFG